MAHAAALDHRFHPADRHLAAAGGWFTDLRLKLKGQTFFKTVIYMPNLIMASAFAMLFFALFSDNGPVNAALVGMGILKEPSAS